MIEKKKIAVIGVYGQGPDFTTGQAVKCMELINWLKETYGTDQVQVVNTYQWKKRPAELVFHFIKAFVFCRNITMLPAQHGIKVFGPMVYYFNCLFHRNVHYIVIGGWLPDYLKSHDRMRKQIGALQGVFVETKVMERNLKALGLKNIHHMPNFRKSEEHEEEGRFSETGKIPVCIYSRITESKGIEDGIEIVKQASERLGGPGFCLDIYGKVAEEFQLRFQELLKENHGFVRYCGVREAHEGSRILRNYFALLFPSYYEGEGIPGTVLDAFAAGTPVLANDWKYIREMVNTGENGVVYPFRCVEKASEELVRMYQDSELYQKLKEGADRSAEYFSTERILGEYAGYLL